MNHEKPTYTIVAGINGAGKSTLYRLLDEKEKNSLGIRVNADELAKKFDNAIIGMKEAVKLKQQCIQNHVSFHQETTFTGKTIVNDIDKIRNQGYKVNLLYVGVDSVDIAISRVAKRVSNGEHDIPLEDITRRYPVSLKNLSLSFDKFDNVSIYDNSKNIIQPLALVRNQKLTYIESKDIPSWSKDVIQLVYEQQKQVNKVLSQMIQDIKCLKEYPLDNETMVALYEKYQNHNINEKNYDETLKKLDMKQLEVLKQMEKFPESIKEYKPHEKIDIEPER